MFYTYTFVSSPAVDSLLARSLSLSCFPSNRLLWYGNPGARSAGPRIALESFQLVPQVLQATPSADPISPGRLVR